MRQQMPRELKSAEFKLHIKTQSRTIRIPMHLDNQITAMSQAETCTYSEALFKVMDKGLKATINERSTFFCQVCSTEHSTKKMHILPVGFEHFIVCDDCFFSNRYKDFIKRIL